MGNVEETVDLIKMFHKKITLKAKKIPERLTFKIAFLNGLSIRFKYLL